MENTGITRRIDDLGRIVIPKEIRKKLKIRDSDELEINVIDNRIVLNKYENLEKDRVVTLLLYTMGKLLDKNVLYTSKDKVIDYYLKNKGPLLRDELSSNVMHIINNRKTSIGYLSKFTLFNEPLEISYIISPLVINGDLIGSLIVYDDKDISKRDEEITIYSKLFLENYLE